ncbi:hypothetical protein Tco_1302122 [Tanacetum coccineum]
MGIITIKWVFPPTIAKLIKKKWDNNGNNNNQRSFSSNNSSSTTEVPTSATPSVTTDQIQQLINMLDSKPQSNTHANSISPILKPFLKSARLIKCTLLTSYQSINWQLARDSKLFKCYIQDLHLKKTLGTGSQHEGLALETDSHGDSENSFAPEGTNEDASHSDSTSLEDFNDATDIELVTSPNDDITVEQSSTSEDNHNITNVDSGQPSLKKSSRTSKLPTKLSDFVLDDKVKYGINKHINYSNLSEEITNTLSL